MKIVNSSSIITNLAGVSSRHWHHHPRTEMRLATHQDLEIVIYQVFLKDWKIICLGREELVTEAHCVFINETDDTN